LVPDEALARIGSDEASVVLLDCLNMWLSNLMAGQGLSADQVAARVERLIQTALACPARVVVVGNEVGQGIVPENRLAREFRDAAGTSHQLLARAAYDAWWVVAGLPVALKRDGRICADF
jgi:adenosylcobinamide kinase/adenosylcobinamide-phosphate guanylyltransferase